MASVLAVFFYVVCREARSLSWFDHCQLLCYWSSLIINLKNAGCRRQFSWNSSNSVLRCLNTRFVIVLLILLNQFHYLFRS